MMEEGEVAESTQHGEDAVDDQLDDASVDDDASDSAGQAVTRRRSSTATSDAKAGKTGSGGKSGKSSQVDNSPGLFGRIARFIREVVAEMRKVNWPSRKELLTYTSVVIVFVVIMMSIVGGLDFGFAWMVGHVFGGQ